MPDVSRLPSAPARRSFKGTRFKISRTTLFNVQAPSGDVVGQAVTIREWEYEDGTKVGGRRGAPPCQEPGSALAPRVQSPGLPSCASSAHLAAGPCSPFLPCLTPDWQGGENVDETAAAAAAAAAAGPPTPEQLAAAEAAVEQQGVLIRCVGGALARVVTLVWGAAWRRHYCDPRPYAWLRLAVAGASRMARARRTKTPRSRRLWHSCWSLRSSWRRCKRRQRQQQKMRRAESPSGPTAAVCKRDLQTSGWGPKGKLANESEVGAAATCTILWRVAATARSQQPK